MRAAALSLVLVALPAGLAAQSEGARPGIITGAEYHSLTFGDGFGTKKITELVVPMGLTLPLGDRLTLDAGTYFVRAERTDSSNVTATITGLTDLVLRGAFQLKRDVAVLTLAVNVPTGQGSLDTQQDQVARAVATDLIPFTVANFGTGFNVTTGLAFAAPVGPWALGLAGSYRYSSSYEPFASNPTSLKPGSEVRFRVGADRLVGQGRFSLGLTFSTFSNDEFGSNARSPGSRIIPQLSWSLPMGTNNNLSFYAWDVYRNANETAADSSIANENTLALGAVYSIRTGRNTLRPQIELRKGWIGPGGLHDNGILFGAGLRYSISAGSRFSVVPGVRADFGSRPIGTTSVSFTGITASLSVRSSL